MSNEEHQKRIAELDHEIERITRDVDAAEAYGDLSSRSQRLQRRLAELRRERDELIKQPRPQP